MKIRREIKDADQIAIWKAAIVLCDGRTKWPRALAKAIRMIEARDQAIVDLARAKAKETSNV